MSDDEAIKKAMKLVDGMKTPNPLQPYVARVDSFEREMRYEAGARIIDGSTDGYSVCISVPHDVSDLVESGLRAAAIAVAEATLPRSWTYSIRFDRGDEEVRVVIDP